MIFVNNIRKNQSLFDDNIRVFIKKQGLILYLQLKAFYNFKIPYLEYKTLQKSVKSLSCQKLVFKRGASAPINSQGCK